MKKLATLMILAATTLVGCGGGSSNSTTPPVVTPPVVTPPDDNTPPVQTSLTVTAVAGYLENAIIFADVNGNYLQDDGEPSATTNAQGQVEFDLIANPEALTSPLIVKVSAGHTIDHTTQTTLRKSYMMIAPPASEVVSPLTTLAYYGAMTEQTDITNTIGTIQTMLGVDSTTNIMADYLSEAHNNEYLHAVARTLVQVLPNDINQLLENQQIMTLATGISGVISSQIASGADPKAIFVNISEHGSAVASELTKQHGIAFTQDVNLWGDHIKDGFLQAASDFTWKIATASSVVQEDVNELFYLYLDFAKAGLAAAALNQYIDIDAGLIVEGAQGQVTVALVVTDDGTTEDRIIIDAMVDDKNIQAQIHINDDAANASTFANLTSDKATVIINPNSSMSLHQDTLYPQHLTLSGGIVNNDAAVSFDGQFEIRTTLLTDSNGRDYVVPSLLSIDGEYKVGETESFSGGLTLLTNPNLVDDSLTLGSISISVRFDAEFDDAPNAQFIFDLNREDLGSELTLTIAYDQKFMTIDIYLNEDEQAIVLTNDRGITLTLDLAIQRNRDNLGQMTLGANPIATVSKIDGDYTITFSDGEQLEIF